MRGALVKPIEGSREVSSAQVGFRLAADFGRNRVDGYYRQNPTFDSTTR